MSNQTDIFLQQVRLLDPSQSRDQVVDIWVSEGIVKAISPQLNVPDQMRVINGNGLILGTGLVDLYSHSGETGHEERETLRSLTEAAIAGGYTRLNILPDTVPSLDHPSQLTLLKQKAPQSVNFSFWGNFTLGGKGEQMTELAELAEAGVVGFSDGGGVKNMALFRRVLEYVKPLDKPVMVMGVNSALKGNGLIRDGATALRFGLPGIPEFCESVAIAEILELVREFKTPVHVMNLSTKRGVELVKQGKDQNLPITASVCWLHLILNTEDLVNYDPNLKLNPPLGNPWDQLALQEGVKTGVIDAIAVDHSPYTYEEKTVAFGEAPWGAMGLELVLPLLWSKLVTTGQFSPLELWQKLSYDPALCLQQKPPSCEVGNKAELILFDPQQTWIVNQTNLQSLSLNTHYLNQEIKGKVILNLSLISNNQ
jgi:dihydroorotase